MFLLGCPSMTSCMICCCRVVRVDRIAAAASRNASPAQRRFSKKTSGYGSSLNLETAFRSFRFRENRAISGHDARFLSSFGSPFG